jgi:hypothetical protein
MELAEQQLDLLRVVHELETPDRAPGTKAAGQRLLEVWKRREGVYSWHASAPWHGTSPYAEELRSKGLLEVLVGMASPRRWDQPAETADEYWLSVTDAGRHVLADASPDA